MGRRPLLDGPSAAVLASYKATVERLLRFGRFVAAATNQPEFSDGRIAEMVSATQRVLEDQLRI